MFSVNVINILHFIFLFKVATPVSNILLLLIVVIFTKSPVGAIPLLQAMPKFICLTFKYQYIPTYSYHALLSEDLNFFKSES